MKGTRRQAALCMPVYDCCQVYYLLCSHWHVSLPTVRIGIGM